MVVEAKQLDLASFVTTTPYFSEYANGSLGATPTINWTNGLKQAGTLSANATATFTAPPGPCNLLLKLAQAATAYTVTWPSTVEWGTDGAPDLSTVSTTHIITFYYDGTNYFGAYKLGYTP